MNRAERHELILDLIDRHRVTRQDELAVLLREQGAEVTQASISRDLDDLGVVKVDGRYARAPIGSAGANPFGVSSIEPSGENLIVLCCSSGLASAVAVRIDAEKIREIVGTIAGDDTIFIAVKDATAQRHAIKKLRALLISELGEL
jgi:transcriptional regulator of arginine metabolism